MPKVRELCCHDWFEASNLVDTKEDFSNRVMQIIGRYYNVIKKERRNVCDLFSTKELLAIGKALASHSWEEKAELLDREVAFKISECDFSKIALDTDDEKNDLIRKLLKLTYLQQCVLAENIRESLLKI